MNYKEISLQIRIKIYEKILHRDSMKLKLERYRLDGAKIGENVRAFSPISSAESYLISVEDNVTISTGVKFCTHDNSAIKIYDTGTDFVGEIFIGNNSFIGMNSILLPGVKIASNCIVGAGSVVTKSFLEKGSVIAGNPARIVGNINTIKGKRKDNLFDFKNLNYKQKRECILDNQDKWVIK